MKKHILALILLAVMACEPAETPEPNQPANPNNPGGNTSLSDNSIRFRPPGGSTVVEAFTTLTTGGAETDGQGNSFYAVKNIFLVQDGTRNFDRVAVGFKSAPSAGTYPIVNVNYYGQIPTGSAGMNVTYMGLNYRALSGTVQVSLVDGKVKVAIDDVVLGGGARVTGNATPFPDSTRCDLRLLTFQ